MKVDQKAAHNRPIWLHFIFGRTMLLAAAYPTDTSQKQISRLFHQRPQTLRSSLLLTAADAPAGHGCCGGVSSASLSLLSSLGR